MKKISSAFAVGLLFGAGLWISGMAKPETVLQFLKLNENWNPALLWTIGSALIVHSSYYWFKLRKNQALCPENTQAPIRRPDQKLVLGSIIFGAGWGLTGICPGPAFAMVLTSTDRALLFITFMTMGWLTTQVFQWILSKRSR